MDPETAFALEAFDRGFDAAMDATRKLLSQEGHLASVALLDQAEAARAEFKREVEDARPD